MAIYENRLLFRQLKYSDSGLPLALESTWAYTVQMGDSHPIPGRYRIRVINVEMVAEESGASVGMHLMCLLEKWTADGWIECMEYMPNSSSEDFYSIESELNKMYKSFTTGVPADRDYFPATPPSPPSKKQDIPKPKESAPIKKDPPETPDFDWI